MNMTQSVQTWPTSPPNIDPTMAATRTDLEAEEAKLVTEDDTPVDNFYSEVQMEILTAALRSSWKTNRKFIVASDVGVFYALGTPPVVPDVFLSMDVQPWPDLMATPGRSYLVWRMGKGPDLAIEIVSNTEGGELTTKKKIYAEHLKVNYYIVWDPYAFLGGESLTVFAMNGGGYHVSTARFFPEIGLGISIWKGEYSGLQSWLRWTDADGKLIPIGKEESLRADLEAMRAETERQRADAEMQRADAEMQRAETEKQRAEQAALEIVALKAKLREHGVDPDHSAK
jgi:Uma2 family endonuclease